MINFKRLVLVLLKSYMHHLLKDERNRLVASFIKDPLKLSPYRAQWPLGPLAASKLLKVL